MKSKGYDSYRGRSPVRSFLKFIIILLVAVLIVGAFAIVFMQRYLVYTADGPKLVLPFLGNSETNTSPSASASASPSSEPLAVVTPEVKKPEWLHAVLLPREALYDGSAHTKLTAAGANAAIFDMKADDGSLGYVSNVALAISAKASSGDPSVNAVIANLNKTEGMYTIARVSCFKDNLLSNADRSLNIMTNSGYRWTDPDNLKWSSPTNAAVRQYITDICVELAKLGFDEILLDNAGYPTQGNLGYIKKGDAYDKTVFPTVISGFYEQVAGALADYDVKLAILTDEETAATGVNALSGQTTEGITQNADQVWLPQPGQTEPAALISSWPKEKPEDIVFTVDSAGDDGQSWALLSSAS
ncbi:hypothetical protein SDC9_46732 [bioreactor metagenome]|uniref:DUF4015 domain-containing protein n=1 Tax=bioreactor metagenome TaxID=1076179 RepID=A0A644W9N4_9ZZZZ